MPYIECKTNVPVKDTQKLVNELGEAIRIIPKKSPEVTMIEVEGGRNLYYAGSAEPCAIILTWVNNTTDMSSAQDYNAKVLEILAENLGVDKKRIYATVQKLECWYAERK